MAIVGDDDPVRETNLSQKFRGEAGCAHVGQCVARRYPFSTAGTYVYLCQERLIFNALCSIKMVPSVGKPLVADASTDAGRGWCN